MAAKKELLIVIPTYDEAANVGAIVDAALARLPDSRRLLIVDDSSPDGTGQIADRIAAVRPEVSVLHRPTKEGIGPAYVDGFGRALADGADLIAQMDADFSHDPADLPRLLAALDDADLVLGSRYVPGGGIRDWGPLRRAISRGGSGYARAATSPAASRRSAARCWRRSTWTRSRPRATRSRSRPPTARSAPASGSPRCRSPSAIAASASRR